MFIQKRNLIVNYSESLQKYIQKTYPISVGFIPKEAHIRLQPQIFVLFCFKESSKQLYPQVFRMIKCVSVQDVNTGLPILNVMFSGTDFDYLNQVIFSICYQGT